MISHRDKIFFEKLCSFGNCYSSSLSLIFGEEKQTFSSTHFRALPTILSEFLVLEVTKVEIFYLTAENYLNF